MNHGRLLQAMATKGGMYNAIDGMCYRDGLDQESNRR